MTVVEAAILGAVQGITEFLPISSSGHLIIIPGLFGWSGHLLIFDTTIHLATALALIVFFWKDLIKIAQSIGKDIFLWRHGTHVFSEDSVLGVKVLIASIPAGILGFFLDSVIEEKFREVSFTVLFTLLGSVTMMLAEFTTRRTYKNTKTPSMIDSLIIGFFQSLALFPGFSRSGSTISGGMILGLNRESAARFSFLASIPIVLAAGLFKLFSTDFSTLTLYLPILFVGFLASFFIGLLSVKFMMSYLKTKNLWVFIVYRLILVLLMVIIL